MPSYEFAANSATKDKNFEPLWLRHSIYSVCEVHYLASMRKCLIRSGADLRVNVNPLSFHSSRMHWHTLHHGGRSTEKPDDLIGNLRG